MIRTNTRSLAVIVGWSFFCMLVAHAQPVSSEEGIVFLYQGKAKAVFLGGDFNQWEWRRTSLMQGDGGVWTATVRMSPGTYQYKYVVETDSIAWVLDPENPATVTNYNESGKNNIFTITEAGQVRLEGYPLPGTNTMSDDYPHSGRTLYLNIIWHQHQPLYLDPATDQLQGPWVRTHATKDYYDMTAALERYPNIHFTVNLTSSLLHQLEEYYVNRLKPYVDTRNNAVDAERFLKELGGKTDPWIDLALTPTETLTAKDKEFLLTNVWNALGISEVMINRFPEYKELKSKVSAKGPGSLSVQEQREVKFWFYLAHFDPDFLRNRVRLASGVSVDVTDIVEEREDGTFWLKQMVTEALCNRIVAETYKICAAIVPLHKQLMYHPKTHRGQLEVLTTPYYHPILPLIYDSDLARVCQPNDPMPSRFSFPEDADAQVEKAVEYFKATFGLYPSGMWPGEGSVAHDLVPVFSRHNIMWLATDEKILYRSRPEDQPVFYPYVVRTSNGSESSVVTVFRETELSDKIGFVYQNYAGEDAADDFIRSVLRYAPGEGDPDRLLTVILDGENAWEWYRRDNDGKEFQNALYRKLSKLYENKQVITATVTEYIGGNPNRGIPPHPVGSLPKLEWLWPGSWINANYDTWIGEDEENTAWEYLLVARKDLGSSGIQPPDPKAKVPRKGSKAWYGYKAWEAMYAAEGSDWFWWYGTDQNAPAGDKPFDLAYITHLRNVYEFARKAGASMPNRRFEPIIRTDKEQPRLAQGTMAQSDADLVTVVLHCDARDIYVRTAIYVAGNHPALGNWNPNVVRMFDDGSHGDAKPGDNVWSLEVQLPAGFELQYKYTNSGPAELWSPGEEFAAANRSVRIPANGTKKFEVRNVFGNH